MIDVTILSLCLKKSELFLYIIVDSQKASRKVQPVGVVLPSQTAPQYHHKLTSSPEDLMTSKPTANVENVEKSPDLNRCPAAPVFVTRINSSDQAPRQLAIKGWYRP